MSLARSRAQHYLGRHKKSPKDFGAGPLIDRGKLRIVADMEAAIEGLVLLRTTAGFFPDCSRMAHNLWRDIDANDPHMKPVIASHYGNIHFWVEVEDERGRTIQIDPTPWYAGIDPGHQRITTVEPAVLVPQGDSYQIEADRGMIVCVRKIDRGFLTTTMRGFWPRAVEFGEDLKRNPQLGCDMPDLRLILIIRQALGPLTPAEQSVIVPVYFDVMDNRCVGQLKFGRLGRFIDGGEISLGACNLSGEDTIPSSSVNALERFVRRFLGDEGVEELRQNLERVIKLVNNIAPVR